MDRVCATSAGVNAIMLACQTVLDPGDKVVTLAPHWPNIGAIPLILSAPVETVPLHLAQGLWRVDLDRLLAAITPETRLVLLNSPGNPTGFALTREEQQAILAHCRRTGTWILADEVYERLYYEGPRAPSFLDIAEPEDRVIAVNSFSKSWAMTGWRLGWLVVPPTLTDSVAKLVEYNTSCAPVFVQRAGVAALDQGDDFILEVAALYRRLRDKTAAALNTVPGVTAPVASGGMYSFFRVDGLTDSLAEAKRMSRGAKVGLAPGSAFGPGGEGHFRLCFAQQEATLDRALDRVTGWLRGRLRRPRASHSRPGRQRPGRSRPNPRTSRRRASPGPSAGPYRPACAASVRRSPAPSAGRATGPVDIHHRLRRCRAAALTLGDSGGHSRSSRPTCAA